VRFWNGSKRSPAGATLAGELRVEPSHRLCQREVAAGQARGRASGARGPVGGPLAEPRSAVRSRSFTSPRPGAAASSPKSRSVRASRTTYSVLAPARTRARRARPRGASELGLAREPDREPRRARRSVQQAGLRYVRTQRRAETCWAVIDVTSDSDGSGREQAARTSIGAQRAHASQRREPMHRACRLSRKGVGRTQVRYELRRRAQRA